MVNMLFIPLLIELIMILTAKITMARAIWAKPRYRAVIMFLDRIELELEPSRPSPSDSGLSDFSDGSASSNSD